MENSIKYVVMFDTEPWYSSLSKVCHTMEEAEKEAKRLEKKGFYVDRIRKEDPEYFRSILDENN